MRLLSLRRETFKKLLAKAPEFRARIEERISQYDYKQVANVPLDFAEEILPADFGLHHAVAPEQVEEHYGDPDQDVDDEAELPEDEQFGKRRQRIRRFPHVYQLDEMDCGAACLAMVTRHFGRAVSLGHIRDAVGTGPEGTSLLGITHGAQAVGLAARSVKASRSRLAEMPLPAVVHWDGNHWVVLYDVDSKRVRIADPGRGHPPHATGAVRGEVERLCRAVRGNAGARERAGASVTDALGVAILSPVSGGRSLAPRSSR